MCARSPFLCTAGLTVSSAHTSSFSRRPALAVARSQRLRNRLSTTPQCSKSHSKSHKHEKSDRLLTRCTAKEVEETVANKEEHDDLSQQEESDAADESSGTDKEEPAGKEPAPTLDSVAASTIDAFAKGKVDKAYLENTFLEVGEIFTALETDISESQRKCKDLEEEKTDLQSKYLRLSADFDNFRKRSDNERVQLKASATADIVLQLLPLLDNFELARQQVVPETEGEENVNNSYQSLYKQTVDTLKSLGVEPIKSLGVPFDPEVHEAILREPSDKVPDGTVLEEFRRGFLLKGNLLRASMVKVSSAEQPAPSPADEETTESSEKEPVEPSNEPLVEDDKETE